MWICGEFDEAAKHLLPAAFSWVLGRCPRAVVIDVSGLEFIGAAGLLALLRPMPKR